MTRRDFFRRLFPLREGGSPFPSPSAEAGREGDDPMQAIFMEAMRQGVDPATMDPRRLRRLLAGENPG